MDIYTSLLYDEFIKARIPNKSTKSKYERLLFEKWLLEKQDILRLYYQYLKEMDLVPRRGVVELNKGSLDSVLDFIDSDCLGLSVSKYFSKIERLKKSYAKISGEINLDNKKVLLNYNDKLLEIDKYINTFITQFPLDFDTIKIMNELIYNGKKQVFIGTYGRLDDLDYKDKIKQLIELKKEISLYTNKNIEGDVINTSDYYMAVITPKFKYKKH